MAEQRVPHGHGRWHSVTRWQGKQLVSLPELYLSRPGISVPTTRVDNADILRRVRARYRGSDEDFAIIQSAIELREYSKFLFTRNLSERMFSYALGRGIEQTDWITIRQIARAVAADGYKAQRLVLEIARSQPFQFRRPAGTPAAASTP